MRFYYCSCSMRNNFLFLRIRVYQMFFPFTDSVVCLSTDPFCGLSIDRSIASSKANFPQSAILCFLFKFLVSYLSITVLSRCLSIIPHFSVTSIIYFIFLSLRCFIRHSSARCDQSSYSSFFFSFVGYDSFRNFQIKSNKIRSRCSGTLLCRVDR